MTTPDTIRSIESCHASIRTPRPMALGGITVESRDFLFVRVTTEDGLEGISYSLSRSAPVDIVLHDLISPRVVGRPSEDLLAIRERLDRQLPMLGMVGLVNRAYSLLDIALWDLMGKRAQQPVFRLLGSGVREPRVLFVAPYRDSGMPFDDYAAELAGLATQEVSHVKVYPEPEWSSSIALVSAVRDALPPDKHLVLDAAWRWRAADDVVEAAESLAAFGLAWLEDPLPISGARQLASARGRSRVPIAAGDESSVADDVHRAIDERAVDILRLDATCVGGLTTLRELSLAADVAGIPVSTHVYPEFHRHVAIALPGLSLVETFGLGNPFWGLDTLLDCPAVSELTSLPSSPGFGMEVDWNRIQSMSFRRLSSQSPAIG